MPVRRTTSFPPPTIPTVSAVGRYTPVLVSLVKDSDGADSVPSPIVGVVKLGEVVIATLPVPLIAYSPSTPALSKSTRVVVPDVMAVVPTVSEPPARLVICEPSSAGYRAEASSLTKPSAVLIATCSAAATPVPRMEGVGTAVEILIALRRMTIGAEKIVFVYAPRVRTTASVSESWLATVAAKSATMPAVLIGIVPVAGEALESAT